MNEAQQLFYYKFSLEISSSSIWLILKDAGLTWNALERRAIQIRTSDIARFTLEMNNISWTLNNLLFLDEVGFDNHDMMRKGYGIKGRHLVFQKAYVRQPRVSTLCFLGINGMMNCFVTKRTFFYDH